MKSVRMSLAALLVVPVVGCAQDQHASPDRLSHNRRTIGQSKAAAAGPDRKAQDADTNPRRLETVTWNSVKHELTWTISKGEKKEGASYKALSSESYLINMDDATMAYNADVRRFSREEAANVHVLMDLIAKYAIDSTVWWDDGQGEPVNGDGKSPARRPEKQRHSSPDNDGSAIHVSAPHSDAAAAQLQAQIRMMEKRLAELKRLRAELDGSLRLASYSPARY